MVCPTSRTAVPERATVNTVARQALPTGRCEAPRSSIRRDSADAMSAPHTGAYSLDVKQLALASLSSVLGGVMATAFGGGVAMTFFGMALAPWLTAFVEHPGPHRRRRVALVVLFAFVMFACRWLLAQVGILLERRHCRDGRSRTSAASCRSSQRQRWRVVVMRWWRVRTGERPALARC